MMVVIWKNSYLISTNPLDLELSINQLLIVPVLVQKLALGRILCSQWQVRSLVSALQNIITHLEFPRPFCVGIPFRDYPGFVGSWCSFVLPYLYSTAIRVLSSILFPKDLLRSCVLARLKYHLIHFSFLWVMPSACILHGGFSHTLEGRSTRPTGWLTRTSPVVQLMALNG